MNFQTARVHWWEPVLLRMQSISDQFCLFWTTRTREIVTSLADSARTCQFQEIVYLSRDPHVFNIACERYSLGLSSSKKGHLSVKRKYFAGKTVAGLLLNASNRSHSKCWVVALYATLLAKRWVLTVCYRNILTWFADPSRLNYRLRSFRGFFTVAVWKSLKLYVLFLLLLLVMIAGSEGWP